MKKTHSPELVPQELRRHVEQQVLPRYEAFDTAHRGDHVRAVIARSLELAERLGADPAMAYAVAAYHDTGLAAGREEHHIESGRILAADTQLRRWFTPEQIHTMRCAVEDHRASAGRAPRSLYGRIVAEADRLIDPRTIARRTVQYGRDHYPELDREGHFARFCRHLTEKYGDGGYLRLWLAESENARQLELLRALIRDPARLRRLFDEAFDGCPE